MTLSNYGSHVHNQEQVYVLIITLNGMALQYTV